MQLHQPETLDDAPVLHVFAQEGGWHWGITVPRDNGCGFRVVAYSEKRFARESDAAVDGKQMLDLIKTRQLTPPACALEITILGVSEC